MRTTFCLISFHRRSVPSELSPWQPANIIPTSLPNKRQSPINDALRHLLRVQFPCTLSGMNLDGLFQFMHTIQKKHPNNLHFVALYSVPCFCLFSLVRSELNPSTHSIVSPYVNELVIAESLMFYKLLVSSGILVLPKSILHRNCSSQVDFVFSWFNIYFSKISARGQNWFGNSSFI